MRSPGAIPRQSIDDWKKPFVIEIKNLRSTSKKLTNIWANIDQKAASGQIDIPESSNQGNVNADPDFKNSDQKHS